MYSQKLYTKRKKYHIYDTLFKFSFDANGEIVVKISSSGLEDTITLVKVIDGSDGEKGDRKFEDQVLPRRAWGI